MFHSKQLALDAAVLLTKVESCSLSPSTAVVLQASFATPVTAAAHTRCPCHGSWHSVPKLQHVCVHLLAASGRWSPAACRGGKTPIQQPLCASDSAPGAACGMQAMARLHIAVAGGH